MGKPIVVVTNHFLGEVEARIERDALGEAGRAVHDDVDAGHFDIEKPAGFDHFESLVEERGVIDGDL